MNKKEIIKNLKNKFNGRLEKRVLNIVLNDLDNNNYEGTFKEQLKYILDYYTSHGCVTGCVTELIYYTQTSRWFNTYKKEIINLVNNLIDMGYFEEEYNEEKEAFCIKLQNEYIKIKNGEISQKTYSEYEKNILAWLSFEETVYNIQNYVYEEL